MKTIRFFLSVLLFSFALNCYAQNKEVDNIVAFTKLYGGIRWFCPSDEAATIDWDKFALLGMSKVKNVNSHSALIDTLNKLYGAIVPNIKFSKDSLFSFSDCADNENPVYWQHKGVEINPDGNIWKSIRTNRVIENFYNPDIFFHISNIEKGNKIKLKIKLKKEADVKLSMVLVENSYKEFGWDTQLKKLNIDKNDWNEYILTTESTETIDILTLGLCFQTNGAIEISTISIYENEEPKFVFNADNIERNWYFPDMISSKQNPNEQTITFCHLPTLIENMDKPKPYFTIQLADSLWCQFPTILSDNNSKTFPATDSISYSLLLKEIQNFSDSTNSLIHLSSVAIAWNMFNYFYPYPEDILSDWNRELTIAIQSTLQAKSEEDFLKTFNKMLANLQDAHLSMVFPKKSYSLPLCFDYVEDKVIVSRVGYDTLGIKIGDEVVAIDGRNAKEEILRLEKFVSGSPQYKKYFSVNVLFGNTTSPKSTALTLKRNNELFTQQLNSYKGEDGLDFYTNPLDAVDFKELGDGIYYLKMVMIFKEYLEEILNSLKDIKGLIFDLRDGGLVMSNDDILKFLTDKEPEQEQYFLKITQYPNSFVYTPSKQKETIWEGQKIAPLVVFLSDASMISQTESLLNTVKYNNLGLIVGETTGGTNGNINHIELFGRYSFYWTGLRVLKPNGEKHNGVGVEPDVKVNKTIKAFQESRDEYVEEAYKLVTNSKN